jgi:surface protein
MEFMFDGASSFNQSLNKWNVSKVTDMQNMFAGARSFNQPLNKWNVSKVTDMFHMFSGATSLGRLVERNRPKMLEAAASAA